MKKFFLYAHGGSENHGCEAIVRSTLKILNEKKAILISSNPDEDIRNEISSLCSIVKDRSDSISKNTVDFMKAYLALKIKKDYIPLEKLYYKEAFSQVKKGDIALSIGGDNYCYADVEKYIMFHDMLKDRGTKTVLWGCSVEPDVVKNKEIAHDLSRYNLITARETISYEALKNVNPNTILVSDPAFQLDVVETELPKEFLIGNTVGINLSPMSIANEKIEGMAYKNYYNLIQYIINDTNMNVALIPHVTWQDNDDRIPLKRLYDDFQHTNRVCLIDNQNCCKLKYVISKCKYFVGARTHSTIAAYSTLVPTMVVGYSVKAKGIAKDIFGTYENYVIPVQDIQNEDELIKGIKFIMMHQDEMKLKQKKYLDKIDVDLMKKAVEQL